jgi:hypothetical protein
MKSNFAFLQQDIKRATYYVHTYKVKAAQKVVFA